MAPYSALACILLVFSGVLLMLATGVGPFSRAPWEEQYFRFRRLPTWPRRVIVLSSAVTALLCTLYLIGVFA